MIRNSVRSRHLLFVGPLLLFGCFMGVWLVGKNSPAHGLGNNSLPQSGGETLVVHFADGPYAVTTEQEYAGPVTITVSGVGQASGTQYSDAFYILTDHDGNPIDPWHPDLPSYNWILWINGENAKHFIPGQVVPDFERDHIYVFEINAPGVPLTFGVGDVYTPDNTGSYTVRVGGADDCAIPFYSQRDHQWAEHPLRTDGRCSPSCGTIGACGCTLTAAAMIFAYHGADLRPDSLSDCMDRQACPFHWAVGASCTQGQSIFVGRVDFSWARLEQELNVNGHQVILGMTQANNTNNQHWVVVTHGHGSNPSDYLILDPWSLSKDTTNLNAYTRQGYVPLWLAMYSGQPVCSNPGLVVEKQEPRVGQTIISSNGPPNPTSRLEGRPNSIISGSIMVYQLFETSLVVELTAVSNVGNITEMQIWTDSRPNASWQPFDTLHWIPWEPGDQVYARFRDEFDNVSAEFSDTLHPIFSPSLGNHLLFLPAIANAP
jgi:hypothetical protein